MAKKTNKEEVEVMENNEAKTKRTRRSFEEVKKERITAIEEKIKETEKRLAELREKLEEEKNRQPGKRGGKKSNKTLAKETLEQLLNEGYTKEQILEKLKKAD